MKKFVCMMLVVVCVSFCACEKKDVSEADVGYNYEDYSYESTVDAYAEAEDEAKSKCASYMSASGYTVSGFTVESKSIQEGNDKAFVSMSGSFYSKDRYGDVEGKYVFDITVSVELHSGIAYVEKSNIMQKY